MRPEVHKRTGDGANGYGQHQGNEDDTTEINHANPLKSYRPGLSGQMQEVAEVNSSAPGQDCSQKPGDSAQR